MDAVREAEIRAYTNIRTPDPWQAPGYLIEVFEALDAERLNTAIANNLAQAEAVKVAALREALNRQTHAVDAYGEHHSDANYGELAIANQAAFEALAQTGETP